MAKKAKGNRVQDQNEISGEDGFFRPLFCLDHEKESAGHIKICSAETAASGEGWEQDVLWIFCGSGKSSISAPYIQIRWRRIWTRTDKIIKVRSRTGQLEAFVEYVEVT